VGLGLVAYHEGEDAEVERAYQQALARPEEPFSCPCEGLGMLWLRQGWTEEEAPMLERAIALDPAVGHEKYLAQARIRLELGDVDGALGLLGRAQGLCPDDEEIRTSIVEAERRVGEQ
jgi:tetratricopeptide (TPR) repeat protein